MTRTQAITKTILAVLGIYGIASLGRVLPGHLGPVPSERSILTEAAWLLVCLVPIGLTAYVLILRNTSLASVIAGGDNRGEPTVGASWLAKALRIGLVLAGLMLLPGSIPTFVKILKVPISLRFAVDEMIVSGGLPSNLRYMPYHLWYSAAYELLKALLAIYLILGAPHLIRSQLSRTLGPPAPSRKPGKV